MLIRGAVYTILACALTAVACITDVFKSGDGEIQNNYVLVDSWGTRGTDPGQMLSPWMFAVDTRGFVYVSDSSHRIQTLTSDGKFANYLPNANPLPTDPGYLSSPTGVAIDKLGRVLIADSGEDRVQIFDRNGAWVETWVDTVHGFSSPMDIAVDSNGYVIVTHAHEVLRFLPDRRFDKVIAPEGGGEGQVTNPYGIALDGNKWVFVADLSNNRIQQFSNTGFYRESWPRPGDRMQLQAPRDVAVDGRGHVIVVDGSDRVFIFDTEGEYISEFEFGETTPDVLTGIGIDNDGTALVVDTRSNRILLFEEFGSLVLH